MILESCHVTWHAFGELARFQLGIFQLISVLSLAIDHYDHSLIVEDGEGNP
jgi:hypothetical protein